MRWKIGLSGIKTIRARYTIGMIAQIIDRPNTLNCKKL